jgi:alpha-L-fucosidase
MISATGWSYLLVVAFLVQCNSYEPTWESLDSRPLPQWYEDAKFGIFLHWGVFSVPAFGSEWFWEYWSSNDTRYVDFVRQTEGSRFSYTDYASRFDATLYHPDQWADIFAKAGAQYVVLTSKHHEGYTMWNSRDVPTTWNWNVMDVGPKRDLLGDLAVHIKNTTSPYTNQTLQFGIYHSLFEWFNLLFRQDRSNNFTTNDFVTHKTLPELYDLVRKYEPNIIWSDGDWDTDSTYWKSRDFLAWLATESTVKDTVVWNDRWGRDATCRHGSFWTCQDRYQPSSLVHHKWENCYTVDRTSWGWNRNATLSDYYSTEQLIHTLISTVAFNGNLLLNIGPTADGTLPPAFVDRLLGIGEWLRVNGEAIYNTRPWSVAQEEQNSSVYYTQRDTLVFAILVNWRSSITLVNPVPTNLTTVRMLGINRDLKWSINRNGMIISIPPMTPDVIPCQYAWVLALSNLKTENKENTRINPETA